MQTALKPSSAALSLPARRRGSPRLPAVQTVEAPTTEPTTQAAEQQDGLVDIYVGKGRYVKDDPKKYPGKDNLGPLIGAAGGWAGGEAGLWQLREQLQREKAAQKAGSQAGTSSSSGSTKVEVPAPKGGLKPIYVGYGKNELAKRKAGEPGTFILDDPTKYPAKDDIGFFAGATGGFAGGEAGLKQYVETGELKLRDPNQPRVKQTSPVAVAGLLVAAGAGGGLLLNQLTEVGEGAIKAEILDAPIDEKTKTLLVAAIGLIAAAGALGAGKALVDALQNRITAAGDQVTRLVVGGAFWLVVFVAARFILEL